MAGKGKEKRTREQTSKGNSGVSPPEKRQSWVSRKKKNVIQTSISEWIMDDDNVKSRDSANNIDITPPISPLPLSQPPDMLSPILSQSWGSDERRSKTDNSNHITSPISDALNLVAGAASLRNDFAVCERIMTEKHHFRVEMLDKMNNTVSSIENKIIALEENEHKQTCIAQSIFQASNERQNDLEKKQSDCIAAIKVMNMKCDKIDDLAATIQQMKHSISQKKESTTTSSVCRENMSIAIHGLPDTKDIISTVNHIFDDLNLRHISCVSAYRTPARPDMNHHGVVIATLNSLSDKREVLERKRYLRTMSQYRNVFLKPSKSHPEQVMDANFSLLLNEMSNDDAYFISDNGRIRQDPKRTIYRAHCNI